MSRRAKPGPEHAKGLCVNGDGRPICPPSRVICRECVDKISANLREMRDRLAREAEKGDGRG